MNAHLYGLTLLRLGIASVFLWFGFSQLFDSASWVDIVPLWAVELLNIPPAFIVMGNGAFEIVAGMLIAMRVWVRPIAILLGLHLLVITLEMGLTPTGVRDFGLVTATFALALLHNTQTQNSA